MITVQKRESVHPRYWGYFLIIASVLIGFGLGLLTGYPGRVHSSAWDSGPLVLAPAPGGACGRGRCCTHGQIKLGTYPYRHFFHRLWHGYRPCIVPVHHRLSPHSFGDLGSHPRLCQTLLHFFEKMTRNKCPIWITVLLRHQIKRDVHMRK